MMQTFPDLQSVLEFLQEERGEREHSLFLQMAIADPILDSSRAERQALVRQITADIKRVSVAISGLLSLDLSQVREYFREELASAGNPREELPLDHENCMFLMRMRGPFGDSFRSMLLDRQRKLEAAYVAVSGH